MLAPAKKAGIGSEIPTPQYLVVDSYEKDYTRSFVQPPSYIRGRPGKCRGCFLSLFSLPSRFFFNNLKFALGFQ